MATSNSGRKIIREYESPIDNIYIDIGEKLNPIFKSLKLTPNTLTTFSLLFGILSAYNLKIGNNIISTIFFIMSYIFDCFDGNYARKYKMYSKFGDLYDHVTDFTKFILLFYIMYTLKPNKLKLYIPIIVILSIIIAVHMGCQQQYFDNKQNEFLDNFKILCPNKNWIKYTRYCGSGNIILYISYVILNW